MVYSLISSILFSFRTAKTNQISRSHFLFRIVFLCLNALSFSHIIVADVRRHRRPACFADKISSYRTIGPVNKRGAVIIVFIHPPCLTVLFLSYLFITIPHRPYSRFRTYCQIIIYRLSINLTGNHGTSILFRCHLS